MKNGAATITFDQLMSSRAVLYETGQPILGQRAIYSTLCLSLF